MTTTNPFKTMAENATKREKLVSEYAAFLQTRAKELCSDPAIPNPFATEENRDWLLDQVDMLQEKDDWDTTDIARFSSVFFFLLTTEGVP